MTTQTASNTSGGIINMGVMAHPPAIVMAADGPAWEYVTGGESLTIGETNYFIAYRDTPGLGGLPDTREIVCRLIVPVPVAKAINDQARHIWTKGGH